MTLGQIAFAAYRRTVNGIADDGTTIPHWDDLAPPMQHAWEVAGQAAQGAPLPAGMLRSRAEIEARLADLATLYMSAETSNQFCARLHVQACELLWVLHPQRNQAERLALLQEHLRRAKARPTDT